MPDTPSPPPVMTGWLRKRPRYGTGHWHSRFFVLSSSDACLRAFNSESESAKSSQRVPKKHHDDADEDVPTHAVYLPKGVTVTDPVEKQVRTQRNATKRDKVWVISVYCERDGQLTLLITLGAASRDEAAKWKIVIEQTAEAHGRSRGASVGEDVPRPLSAANPSSSLSTKNKNSTKQQTSSSSPHSHSHSSHSTSTSGGSNAGYSGPNLWPKGEEDRWQVVEVQDGVEIEGEKEFTKQFPSLRARAVVDASPKDVFELIMDDSKRTVWDDNVQHNEVLRQLSPTSHIVYTQMRPIWIGPVSTDARDLVLLRYWRLDDNGTYVITWQSVEDPDLSPLREGFVRGRIFAMGFTITPIPNQPNKASVRFACHADPGGSLSVMPSMLLQRWLQPFVTSVLGIKKALSKGSGSTTLTTTLSEGAVDMVGVVEDEVDEAPPSPSRTTSAQPPASIAASSGSMDNASGRKLRQTSASSGANPVPDEAVSLKLGCFEHAEWGMTPQAEPYNIRGKNYLEDGIKYKTGDYQFAVVGADLYKVSGPVPFIASRSDSPLHAIIKAYPGRAVFAMQFMLPGPPFYSFCFYAVAKKGVLDVDSPFARVWDDFVEGDNDMRNAIFKMIPRVTQGAYLVRKTVGEVPALMGTKCLVRYTALSVGGAQIMNVDVDLGTSAVAGSILSIVKGYATTLTVDLGILLQGNSEDRLPETMMCSIRLTKPHLSAAKPLGADPDPAFTKRFLEMAERARSQTMTKADIDKMGDSDEV